MDTKKSVLAVRARGITKCFGEVVALDGIDLDVAQGQIHGLVGPNGAGKTTLLGLLLGLAVADGGTLEILGAPVGRALAAPAGVAGFVDGPGLYPSLTARQNLAALAALRGRDKKDAGIDEALAEVGLTDVADDRARGFSLGMRQRLGLAAALITKPRLLVLDEPANGLDPAGKKHVHGVLTRLASEGTSVVLSSHRMDDLEALCSEVTILSTGRIVFSGPLSKLAAENRELEYRLLTSDPKAALALAAAADGIRVVEESVEWRGSDAVVVRALVPSLDELVSRIVRDGIAVRELAPVVSPLEAAFLSLTDPDDAPAGTSAAAEEPEYAVSPAQASSPAAAEEPAHADTSAAAGEPAHAGSSAAAVSPAQASSPVAAGAPAPADNSAVAAEEPAHADSPAHAADSAAAEEPAPADSPAAAEAPAHADNSAAAEAPAHADRPAPGDEPENAGDPAEGDKEEVAR